MKQMSLIVSGFGGQGSLFAGILLCHSAVYEGKHTTWIPSYGAEMRGGAVNCSVNISNEEYTIQPEDRIAQMVIAKVEKATIEVTTELATSVRGEGGFGSTGV